MRALDRAAETLADAAVLRGRLRRLWRPPAGRVAVRRQGRDAWDRAGQRAPAALAGALSSALDCGLEGHTHGGRQHRPVRPLRGKQQDWRLAIYAILKPSCTG